MKTLSVHGRATVGQPLPQSFIVRWTPALAGLLVFFVPTSLKALVAVIWCALLTVSWLKLISGSRTRFGRRAVLAWLGLSLYLVGHLLFSRYPSTYLVTSLGFLCMSALYLTLSDSRRPGANSRHDAPAFSWICLAGTAISYLVTADVFPATSQVAVANDSYDKNFLGVLYFLCAFWHLKRRLYGRVVIFAVAGVAIGSRNFFLMALVLLVAMALRRLSNQIGSRRRWPKYVPGKLFALMLLGPLAMVPFSVWWTSNVITADTYRSTQGLNDRSNAVRFNSNVFAYSILMLDESLWFRGYDASLSDTLHIIPSSSLDGTESSLDGAFYNGFRVVQPHNSVLNLFLRVGVLFTIVYLWILAQLIARRRDWFPPALVFPYLTACLIMHSLLVGPLLLLFTVVGRTTPSHDIDLN